jgi:hypothetical protein
MFLNKITYYLIVIILIVVYGCKEAVGPCGDPVFPNFSLKIIDKLTNKAACQLYDSMEFKSLRSIKSIKLKVYKYSSDSSINFSFSRGDTILFRFDSIHNFDTLIPFSTYFSVNGEQCNGGYTRLDSIYDNNKKVESNTIYY